MFGSFGSTTSMLFQFGSFPGLLSLEHRLKVFWVLVSFSQESFRGKNKDFGIRRTQAKILTYILFCKPGKVTWFLYISISSCAKCRRKKQTCLRSFWRFNVVIFMKWLAKYLTFKGMRGVLLALPCLPPGSSTCCSVDCGLASPSLCSSSCEWREDVETWHMRLHGQPR